MLKNKRIQIRISQEFLELCQKKGENLSFLVRTALRNELKKSSGEDHILTELRAKTPYTFFASLDRVVDGDTVVLIVDLGFFIEFKTTFRLKDVNTQPGNTPEGKKATRFVSKELSGCNLVVESYKQEKYGRYLAYIYYHPEHKNFEDILRHGKLLNEELLKAGLAKHI